MYMLSILSIWSCGARCCYKFNKIVLIAHFSKLWDSVHHERYTTVNLVKTSYLLLQATSWWNNPLILFSEYACLKINMFIAILALLCKQDPPYMWITHVKIEIKQINNLYTIPNLHCDNDVPKGNNPDNSSLISMIWIPSCHYQMPELHQEHNSPILAPIAL